MNKLARFSIGAFLGVSMAAVYPSLAPFRYSPLVLTLPANIRWGWTGFQGTNTLAYLLASYKEKS